MVRRTAYQTVAPQDGTVDLATDLPRVSVRARIVFRARFGSLALVSGAVAQLGERLVCNQEVEGSSPFGSNGEGRPTRKEAAPTIRGSGRSTIPPLLPDTRRIVEEAEMLLDSLDDTPQGPSLRPVAAVQEMLVR